MLYRVKSRFNEFSKSLHLEGWPPIEAINKCLCSSPEYKALFDVAGRKEAQFQLLQKLRENIKAIENRWIDLVVHECLDGDEFEKRLLQDTGGGLPPGYSTAIEMCERYYSALEQAVLSTLLTCGHDMTFKESEINKMIPDLKTKFFDKTRVKRNYLNHKLTEF